VTKPLDYIISNEIGTHHAGTEHLAINNTFLRRFLTLVALKTTARFYKWMGPCIPLSKNKIVKRYAFTHLTEGATLRFIADNTSIPVPSVYCSFTHKKRAYIVMQRVRGNPLPVSGQHLSEASRQKGCDQLRDMLQELRSLKPLPGVGVASCIRGSLRDSRIPRSSPRFGPFATIQDFHFWLREEFDTKDQDGDEDWQDIKDMIAMQDGPWPPPVFTHADLNPSNIFLRGDKVVGIMDWELSGWYPHYWE
jgi:aminoglycoside phosphotransferase (APT) family kinase protein